MRDLTREASAARTLHAWLRRVALSAIPIASLAGCGSDCSLPDYETTFQVDGGATTAEHHAACSQHCGAGYSDGCRGIEVTGCVATQSSVTCSYHYTYCAPSPCGRVPAGLKDCPPSRQPSPIAAWLADAARLEGAAVFAFRALEEELIAHHGPADLVARARSAQRDEARHQVAMTKLAARFGAQVRAIEVAPVQARTLREIAIENAVEGCVRETYGAAVAVYQGEWADDRAVRRTMRSIALDEVEHASLGWAVDAWARSLLQPRELTAVVRAREEALATLHRRAHEVVPREWSTALGVPDAQASKRLVAALGPLWS